MKFSELWLREWINLDVDSTTLAKQITMTGLKVESVKPISGNFTGIVVGHILECHKYLDNNNLLITKVDIGIERYLNIICSAPNCRAGLMVVVATVNSPLLAEKFKVSDNKLNIKPLEGILCSFAELGITNNYEGIIELPDNALIGQDIQEYLKLNDNIINIDVMQNRADCFGLLGIARDIAAFNRIQLVKPNIDKIIPVIKDTLPVQINAPDNCPRYLCRIIKNVNVNITTPLWMKEKLRRCGLNSVGVITDITNFILLELGQPVNVFDFSKIESGIVVRYAKHNEIFNFINGEKIKLSSDTLVIADYKKVLMIAGILSSAISSCSSTTRDIVLECAFFKPLIINNCAYSYGLHTNISGYYERGVDPELQPYAIERATKLLISICGGYPGPIIDVTSQSLLTSSIIINLRRKMLDRLTGYVIPDKEVNNILNCLGYKVKQTIIGWQLLVPSWRFDISIEEDVIKDIIRMYGYDKIPNIPVYASLSTSCNNDKPILPLIRVKMLLADLGYQEVITYSFVNPKHQMLIHPDKVPLRIPNPISQNMSVMRLSLWTGLLDTVVYNQNRQQQRIRIFESGLRFVPDNKVDLGVRQDLMLAGIITGPRFNEHWDQHNKYVDFYDIKGDIEAVIRLTGKLDDIKFIAKNHPALHPGQSAEIYFKNESIGFIGALHPVIKEKMNLNNYTFIFEIFWEKIADYKTPKISSIPCFPTNRRDITIVVDDNVTLADIIKECKKVSTNQLVSINLLSVYKGKGISKGFKSITLSLILQDITHTLEEREINITISKYEMVLKQKFQAFLRN